MTQFANLRWPVCSVWRGCDAICEFEMRFRDWGTGNRLKPVVAEVCSTLVLNLRKKYSRDKSHGFISAGLQGGLKSFGAPAGLALLEVVPAEAVQSYETLLGVAAHLVKRMQGPRRLSPSITAPLGCARIQPGVSFWRQPQQA